MEEAMDRAQEATGYKVEDIDTRDITPDYLTEHSNRVMLANV